MYFVNLFLIKLFVFVINIIFILIFMLDFAFFDVFSLSLMI